MNGQVIENHTKYSDLPECLRCSRCKISPYIPQKVVSGDYGFFWQIECECIDVTWNKNDYGGEERTYWYDPNTQRVWVDGAGQVEKGCGFFEPMY